MSVTTAPERATTRQRLRLGCVSFLNARPLIYGLDQHQKLDLALDVPSRLLQGMIEHRFDVALLPVIDYQRMEGLRLLTAGGIGCDGPTLTVRIFSPTPIDEIQTLACDTDSHTSVALARIVLAERYGVRPRILDFDFHRHAPCETLAPGTARLLIGDKVVCKEPRGLPHQLDLGEAWKQMTGLPFVFAAWMARSSVDLGSLSDELEQAKRAGLRHVDEIIQEHAIPRGWPATIARKYLTQYLQFDVTDRHLDTIRLFHKFAKQYGLIEHQPWDLNVVRG